MQNSASQNFRANIKLTSLLVGTRGCLTVLMDTAELSVKVVKYSGVLRGPDVFLALAGTNPDDCQGLKCRQEPSPVVQSLLQPLACRWQHCLSYGWSHCGRLIKCLWQGSWQEKALENKGTSDHPTR